MPSETPDSGSVYLDLTFGSWLYLAGRPGEKPVRTYIHAYIRISYIHTHTVCIHYIYIYILFFTYIHVYIYIYIYRERERDYLDLTFGSWLYLAGRPGEKPPEGRALGVLYIYIYREREREIYIYIHTYRYTYIYIYIWRERERCIL